MEIQYHSDYSGAEVKIAMQFVSKSGTLNIRRANIEKVEGLKLKLAPIVVKEHPQLQITGTCTGIVNKPPVIMIKYTQFAQERSLEFSLPIFVHKFLQPHPIERGQYDHIYDEYSKTANPNIFKLDELIQNPSPPIVPLKDVIIKMGGLIGQGLRIHANAHPNPQHPSLVWGTAQYSYKPEGEVVL